MTRAWACFPRKAFMAQPTVLLVLAIHANGAEEKRQGGGWVGVVFVSGGEREGTANETAPAASSLSQRLQDSVRSNPSSRNKIIWSRCWAARDKELQLYAFLVWALQEVESNNCPLECTGAESVLPCPAASGMLLLETKTMSAK